ncbi:hypothetical protein [Allobaculum sp. Allo2]|uniref:hypothetical protein n=1 Tax=Allobaculum sp. Allo2 TaxID=2853432 RepID=UPI001F61FD14|nr:hypothetical protein [Allobaculum sp. Allo2]
MIIERIQSGTIQSIVFSGYSNPGNGRLFFSSLFEYERSRLVSIQINFITESLRILFGAAAVAKFVFRSVFQTPVRLLTAPAVRIPPVSMGTDLNRMLSGWKRQLNL